MNWSALRSALFSNLWLKGLSVLLAAGTWVYVSERTTTEETVRIPLHLTDPDGRFILDQTWKEVQVTLRGPAMLMNQLQPENLKMEIDVAARLRDRVPDTSRAPQPVSLDLRPTDVRNLPRGIAILRLDQKTVTITLDQISEKPLAVLVNRAGKPPDGLEIHRVYPVPNQVMVRGPKSVLAQLDQIATVPVPLGRLRAGESQLSRPLDTHALVNGQPVDCLRPDPPKIDVWIVVIPVPEKSVLRNVPIEVRGLPGFHYVLLTADKTKPLTDLPEVEIRGPKKALDQPKLRAFVDVTAVKNPREQPELVTKVQFTADPDIEVLTPPPDAVVQIRTETP